MGDAGVVHEHVESRRRSTWRVSTASPVVLAGDVEVEVAGVVAELLGDELAVLVEHVAQHDLRPLGHEQPGLGRALAPGAAPEISATLPSSRPTRVLLLY